MPFSCATAHALEAMAVGWGAEQERGGLANRQPEKRLTIGRSRVSAPQDNLGPLGQRIINWRAWTRDAIRLPFMRRLQTDAIVGIVLLGCHAHSSACFKMQEQPLCRTH
jgi:hypothetical protein